MLSGSLIYKEKELLNKYKDQLEESDIEENLKYYEKKRLLEETDSEDDDEDDEEMMKKVAV